MSLPVKIGNYRFERNLGNGTFGKVKRKSQVTKMMTTKKAPINHSFSNDPFIGNNQCQRHLILVVSLIKQRKLLFASDISHLILTSLCSGRERDHQSQSGDQNTEQAQD